MSSPCRTVVFGSVSVPFSIDLTGAGALDRQASLGAAVLAARGPGLRHRLLRRARLRIGTARVFPFATAR